MLEKIKDICSKKKTFILDQNNWFISSRSKIIGPIVLVWTPKGSPELNPQS